MDRPQRFLIAVAILLGCWSVAACSNQGTEDGTLPSLPASSNLRLQTISSSLTSPVFVTAAPNDSTRLFVVEQAGVIRIFDLTTNTLLSTAFLDIRGLVLSGGERGLLGMAFDSQYDANRQFYIFYTDLAGNIVIARYLRQLANANLAVATSDAILLTVLHPTFNNHNGGMLVFGPDGCLYAGIGDGGGGGDPNNNAQNNNSRLGKILRISPATGAPCTNNTPNPFVAGAAPEVWSTGLRNPWRFSFDRLTNELYIGDVGQSVREEIDFAAVPNAGRALNFGWRLMEGFLCFNPITNCNQGGLTLPVLDYPHLSGACSVTGGYVYRGSAAPLLRGTYFYADYCNGFVRSFRLQNSQVTEQTEWPLLSPPGGQITSFGEDAPGELYLVTQSGGLFKFVPN